jgi:hypothetical protein
MNTSLKEAKAWLEKQRAFLDTPIGKAFHKFKQATIRAWSLDTEDSYTDKNRKCTAEAHALANEAERELRALIEK